MKIIKIMWKLSLAFVAAGGQLPIAVMANLDDCAPGYTNEVFDRRREIDRMMLSETTPNDEIMGAIASLEDFIKHQNDLEGDDRTRWEPCKKSILTYLDEISTDLPLHREKMKQMNDIAILLKNDKPCYAELREFIASAKLPLHLEQANKFKEDLVKKQMITIKFMMLGSKTGEEIRQAIQDLMDFIQEKDDLEFQGKLEFLTLNNMIADLDSHRQKYVEKRRLSNLISALAREADKENAKSRVEQALDDFKKWKISIKSFGAQYQKDLKKLNGELIVLTDHYPYLSEDPLLLEILESKFY